MIVKDDRSSTNRLDFIKRQTAGDFRGLGQSYLPVYPGRRYILALNIHGINTANGFSIGNEVLQAVI